MKLTIPLDPTGLSMNRLNGSPWATYRLKVDWMEAVQWIAQSKHNGLPFKYPTVTYTVYFRTRHLRDEDNFSLIKKFCNDGLTRAGVITDDNSQAIDLRPLVFEYDKAKPRVEIEIKETE
jgi:Holliday junction resolvase RusA-like endonuclease